MGRWFGAAVIGLFGGAGLFSCSHDYGSADSPDVRDAGGVDSASPAVDASDAAPAPGDAAPEIDAAQPDANADALPSGGACQLDADCLGESTLHCAEDQKCHDSCKKGGSLDACNPFGSDCCVDAYCDVSSAAPVCRACVPAGGAPPKSSFTSSPNAHACCSRSVGTEGKCI